MSGPVDRFLDEIERRLTAELAEREDARTAELATELASRQQLRERLSRYVGQPVVVGTRTRPFGGLLAAVLADACVLGLDSGDALVVPLVAVDVLRPSTAPRPTREDLVGERLGWLTLLRELASRRAEVVVHGRAGTWRGELVASAADHLVLACGGEELVVPAHATDAVRFAPEA